MQASATDQCNAWTKHLAMPQGSAAPASQGATCSPLSAAVEAQAHRHIVQELQSMGFPRDRAARAAIAVSNAGRLRQTPARVVVLPWHGSWVTMVKSGVTGPA